MGYWKLLKMFFLGDPSKKDNTVVTEQYPLLGVIPTYEAPPPAVDMTKLFEMQTPQETMVLTAEHLRSKYEAEAPAMREKIAREVLEELDKLLLDAFEGKQKVYPPTCIYQDLVFLKCLRNVNASYWFDGFANLVQNHVIPEYKKRGFTIRYDPDYSCSMAVISWELPAKDPLTPAE